MFTPGDNDWTDCDRPSNGGFNSLERLDHERSVFFSTTKSLGKKQMKQEVQSTPLCLGVNGPTACVENRRWTFHDVTYATLNVQGSCNNLCDTAPNPAEYAARNAADIAWLDQTFDEAVAEDSAAVMLIIQADAGFDGSDVTRAPLRDPKTLAETDANSGPLDGFQSFLVGCATQHDRVPQARRATSTATRTTSASTSRCRTRWAGASRTSRASRRSATTPANGLNDVHWVKVLVDPKSREVFAFQPQIVPANRVAVPAP